MGDWVITKKCTIKHIDGIESKEKYGLEKQKNEIGLAVGIIALTKEKERSTYRPIGRSCIYDFLFSVCAMVIVETNCIAFLSLQAYIYC